MFVCGDNLVSNLQSLNSNQCCGSQQTVGTLKHRALNLETRCREKPNPVSYADQSHSHLFTGIIITRSGDCIMINVQNTSEKTDPELQCSQQIWCTQIRALRHYSNSTSDHELLHWQRNGVKFRLRLPCCISMTGYIVVSSR